MRRHAWRSADRARKLYLATVLHPLPYKFTRSADVCFGFGWVVALVPVIPPMKAECSVEAQRWGRWCLGTKVLICLFLSLHVIYYPEAFPLPNDLMKALIILAVILANGFFSDAGTSSFYHPSPEAHLLSVSGRGEGHSCQRSQ